MDHLVMETCRQAHTIQGLVWKEKRARRVFVSSGNYSREETAVLHCGPPVLWFRPEGRRKKRGSQTCLLGTRLDFTKTQQQQRQHQHQQEQQQQILLHFEGYACLERERVARLVYLLPTTDGRLRWGPASIMVFDRNPICLGRVCHMFFASLVVPADSVGG